MCISICGLINPNFFRSEKSLNLDRIETIRFVSGTHIFCFLIVLFAFKSYSRLIFSDQGFGSNLIGVVAYSMIKQASFSFRTHRKSSRESFDSSDTPCILAFVEGEVPSPCLTLCFISPHPPSCGFQQRCNVAFASPFFI